MKSKKIIFAVFAVLILLVPLYIILNSEDVLENGHRHKIRLRGYDPFDPFRGKYLRLRVDDRLPFTDNLKEGEPVYVLLEKDSLGFSHFSTAVKERPKHTDYIEAQLIFIYETTVQVKIDNLNKYFINEDKAKKAEEVMAEYTRNRPDELYLAIRVLNGETRIEDIFVREKPLLEYLECCYNDLIKEELESVERNIEGIIDER